MMHAVLYLTQFNTKEDAHPIKDLRTLYVSLIEIGYLLSSRDSRDALDGSSVFVILSEKEGGRKRFAWMEEAELCLMGLGIRWSHASITR